MLVCAVTKRPACRDGFRLMQESKERNGWGGGRTSCMLLESRYPLVALDLGWAKGRRVQGGGGGGIA